MHGEIFLWDHLPSKDGYDYFMLHNYRNVYKVLFNKNYRRLVKYVPLFGKLIDNFIPSYLRIFYNDSKFFYENNSENYWINDVKPFIHFDEKTVGFKLMYSQLQESELLRKWIKNEYNLKIILLVRRNYLKNYISRLNRQKTKIAHSNTKSEKIMFHLTPKKVLSFIKKSEKEYLWLEDFIKQKDYIKIYYEDILSDLNKSWRNILEFIGVPYYDIQLPKLKKRTSDHLSKIIENYDEIKLVLSKKNYSYLFDENEKDSL